MLNIRRYIQELDQNNVVELCKKHNINPPEKGELLVCYNESGELRGIAGIKTELFFEPLIADSSMLGFAFVNQIEGLARGTGNTTIRCVCDKELEDMYNKYGYKTIENNKLILEKEIL